MIRRIFLLFSALGLLIITAIFIAPFILPPETIKRQVVNLIEQNTGWRLVLDGDVSVSVFPNIGLMANDIAISPPDYDPILTAKEARFSVGLAALFGGTVSIQEIFFETPKLNLELGADGKPVWLQPSSTNPQQEIPAIPDAQATQNGIVSNLIDTLSVEKLAINNADITVRKSGEEPTTINNLTFEVALPDPQGSLSLEGSALINNEEVSLSATVPAFKQLLSSNQGALDLSATFKTATISTDGQIDLSEGGTLYDGKIKLDVSDISTIIGPETIVPGSVSAKGTLVAHDDIINLKFEDSRFVDTLFFIDLTVNTGSSRPDITGIIDLGAINIDKLVPARSSDSNPADSVAKEKTTSTAPDFSGLQAFDAHIKFASGSISSGDHKIEDLTATLELNEGILELKISELIAVGGSASGSAMIDTNVQPLITYGSLQAQRLSIDTLLALANQSAVTPKPEGLIGTDIIFGFQGVTSEDIIESINARGTLTLFDASLTGLGLAESFNDPAADQADNIDLEISIDGLINPVSFNGSANWRGERIKAKGTIDPAPLLEGKGAATNATVSLSHLTASFNGIVKPTLPISGRFNAKGKSLRSLTKWLAVDLPPGKGYQAFDIATNFNLKSDQVSLSELTLALDDIRANGKANVFLSDKPKIEATVNFDQLDVDPYIASTATGQNTNTSSLSNTSQSSAWSKAPIDFSFINAADVKLTASVKSLKAQGMKAGPLTLITTMNNGKLKADLSKMAFYNGSATAAVSLDASSSQPTLSARLDTSNISALPFLTDAAEFDRIEGSLNLALDINTNGNSEHALMSAMNGTSNFSFSDGAIRGMNIARSMRALTSGSLNGWNNSQTEKTDFSIFTASFSIRNGIAQNDDLNLVGPLVRVSGTGTASLPDQRIKYRVNPKVVPSLKGQGGQQDLTGFAVPILISGPWDNPKIYPDIKGFLQNPQAGLATLKSLGGGFAKIASGKPGDLVSTLTGGNGGAGAKISGALGNKTGIDVGSLIKDGKIDKNTGVAAALGVAGGLFGGKKANSTQSTPLRPGDVPVPRARPANRPSTPASAVTTILNQVTKPKSQGTGQSIPPAADKVLKGLGGLFNNN